MEFTILRSVPNMSDSKCLAVTKESKNVFSKWFTVLMHTRVVFSASRTRLVCDYVNMVVGFVKM